MQLISDITLLHRPMAKMNEVNKWIRHLTIIVTVVVLPEWLDIPGQYILEKHCGKPSEK